MNFHDKFQDNNLVTAAIQKGVRDALIKHKALGVAIAVWRDGKTVLIPPEDIKIPELKSDAKH